MSMRCVRVSLIASLLCSLSGPVSSREARLQFVLDQNTRQLEGWFSAMGEWVLFPMKNFEDYYPYDLDENDKCVSVLNDTGGSRILYQDFDGNRVIVKGFAVRYDDIPIGDNPVDQFLYRRYYNDLPVFNFCLREFVFVATDILEIGQSK